MERFFFPYQKHWRVSLYLWWPLIAWLQRYAFFDLAFVKTFAWLVGKSVDKHATLKTIRQCVFSGGWVVLHSDGHLEETAVLDFRSFYIGLLPRRWRWSFSDFHLSQIKHGYKEYKRRPARIQMFMSSSSLRFCQPQLVSVLGELRLLRVSIHRKIIHYCFGHYAAHHHFIIQVSIFW